MVWEDRYEMFMGDNGQQVIFYFCYFRGWWVFNGLLEMLYGVFKDCKFIDIVLEKGGLYDY